MISKPARTIAGRGPAVAAFLITACFASVLGAMDLGEVRERVSALQARMIHRPLAECKSYDWQACVRPETTELRALIRDYSLWKLNQSGGDAAGLAKDLRTVNDAYFFKRMAELDQTSGAPQQGDSYVFRKSSPAGDVIVTVNGYVTGELATPNRDIVIQGFRKEGGGYVYAGETGESLFSIMIYHNLDVLPSPIYNEMWLLVSGQVGGFMGDLEKARIFSFDGYRFEELWKPEDRLGMEIDVKGDRLDVVYDHKVDQPHGFPVHHVMEEKLWLSPNGVTRTEIIDNGPGSLPLRKLKQ